MGIENVEELSGDEGESKQESSVERETDQEQRDRKDKETDEYRRARQERLSHVPAPEAKEEEKSEEEE